MQLKQRNQSRFGIAAVMLVGALIFCGCGNRGAEEYFLEEMGTISESEATETADVDAETEQAETVCQPAVCVVHICGAVRNPGVYELPEGSRIMDAVEAADGFLEEADQAACNLAQTVADGCQIYIATREESAQNQEQERSAGIQNENGGGLYPQAGVLADRPEQENSGKVNLNTADAAVLKTLPGIGDSRAAAIIAFRETNGPFTCIEDIMRVSGIKQAAFDKLKDKITV